MLVVDINVGSICCFTLNLAVKRKEFVKVNWMLIIVEYQFFRGFVKSLGFFLIYVIENVSHPARYLVGA